MKDIKIEWKGQKLTIREHEAFEVGEAIEEVLSLSQLANMSEKPQFHKLARCFSIMINHAGGSATPQEVHSAMMKEVKSGGPDAKAVIAVQAISTLVAILMDGAPASEGDEDEGKPSGGSSKAVSA